MDFSLVGLWTQMGWVARGVVIILLIMSMYSIGVTVERFLTFRKGRLAVDRLHRRPAAAGGHHRPPA